MLNAQSRYSLGDLRSALGLKRLASFNNPSDFIRVFNEF